MSWEWIALAAILAVFVVIGVTWKNPITRKYWKYGFILLPAVLVIIVSIINKRSGNRGERRADTLRGTIDDLKENLHDVQMETAIEVTAAKTKNAATIEELKEVKKISDKKERRKRLADMMG